jgi:hypothetical protein
VPVPAKSRPYTFFPCWRFFAVRPFRWNGSPRSWGRPGEAGRPQISGLPTLVGAKQSQIVERVVTALAVRSRYRGLVNLAVEVAIADAVSAFAAW